MNAAGIRAIERELQFTRDTLAKARERQAAATEVLNIESASVEEWTIKVRDLQEAIKEAHTPAQASA